MGNVTPIPIAATTLKTFTGREHAGMVLCSLTLGK